MKRDAPSGPRPPAVARDARSLRAQLSRAVGEALKVVRASGGKTAGPSKQRLSDVLWNDRSMIATHATAAARSASPERAATTERADAGTPQLGASSAARSAEPRLDLRSSTPAAAVGRARRETGEGRQSGALPPSARERRDTDSSAVRPAASPAGVRPRPAARVSVDSAGAAREALEPTAIDGPVEVASDGEVAEWLITELDELEVDDSAHEAAELAAPTGPVSPAAGAAELAAPTGPVSPAAGPSSAAPSSTAGSPSPTPPVDAVAPPPAAVTAGSTVPAAAETADPGDDPAIEEPIRTRSMAQLLAKQGHRQRALNIYAWLIKSNGSDASLKAEAEALRQSMAQEG